MELSCFKYKRFICLDQTFIFMKTFWNEDDYNHETDGRVKGPHGVFIPYMQGIDDPIYKRYVEEILKLDWLHYDLYLVGGILNGWKTTDIDICVTGKRTKELVALLDICRELGPLDMFWVKSLDKIKGDGSRIWKFAKSYDRLSSNFKPWNGKWKKDGLYHMQLKFNAKNREYKKEPLLINKKYVE